MRMPTSSRHIRHDYKTWVDWEQVSVRSLCGVTTRRGLAGIPGITPQPPIVDTGKKRLWGWCWPCVREAYKEMSGVLGGHDSLTEEVVALYVTAMSQIKQQYLISESKFGYRRRGSDVVQ